MPVLRKTINLAVSGNALLATDSVTSLATTDAGVQGEDGAISFHVTVPAEWQDISTKLQIISANGGYDESDAAVNGIINMPLRQGLTLSSGRITVRLTGTTTSGARKSADCKTLMVSQSAVLPDLINHSYPYPVHKITGSGGALVTQTNNDEWNVNVTGTGGDMLQANYAKGNGSTNTNKVDHSIYADSIPETAHSVGLVGEIKAFAGAVAPAGTLSCDGSAVSRTTYAALFTAIGATWGAGDGSTTFNLPDLRDQFLRGASATRTVGTSQSDAMQGHFHSVSPISGSDSASTTPTMIANGNGTGNRVNTSVSISNPISDGTNGEPRIADETRPVNKAVNYIIVY